MGGRIRKADRILKQPALLLCPCNHKYGDAHTHTPTHTHTPIYWFVHVHTMCIDDE